MAFSIAATITKKIINLSPEKRLIKKNIVSLRKHARSMKGGLGNALLTLLSAQGLLQKAAKSSRRLEISNPRIWKILRFKLKGANMIYFLVENMVSEYVDMLSLLEKSPTEFAKVLEALIRAKKTESIFYPGL